MVDGLFTRLLAEAPSYREAVVLDGSGKTLVSVSARAGQHLSDSPRLRAAMAEAAARARDGKVIVSGALRRAPADPRHERLRLFVAPAAGGRQVALLVDTDHFFDGFAVPSTDRGRLPVRCLVLDGERRWIELDPSGDEGSPERWRIDDTRLPADLTRLFEKMGAGAPGTISLGRGAAAQLGLDRRSAVAGFAPVRVGGGAPWSVAVIASAKRVHDRARVSAWRLAASTGLAGLLVGLFGVMVMRQQRRAFALAEALRLSEATAALRERSEKIVETIPVGVLALDGAGRVTSVNPYLADRGVKTASSLAAALPRASDEERALLEELVQEARASRAPVERAGLRLHLAGEEARDVDAFAIPLGRPLPDADFFLALHDRTEMRVLERNLVRAEKLATIGTLAAGVAHEIGTPLGIISGRAEQLQARVPDGEAGEAMKKGLSSILGQVDKVSTTLRQLLDFSRLRPIEAEAITPIQILESAAALLEHHFRKAKVQLELAAPAKVAAVAGDPGQLEQVLVNLLMNAADACAEGGHVRASAAERGDRVAIEISDDGCGIAADHLPSVLDPFFTTKKRGQGTGLGLTIAADIVKNHGGALEIDSVVGSGTTVRVYLPIARAIPPAIPRTRA
jgi:signal transduction histidine kinase